LRALIAESVSDFAIPSTWKLSFPGFGDALGTQVGSVTADG
jgi:hypothetical protein